MDDHIIIVEDDASLADLLCETFTRKGFVATLHREGAGAVEKVLQELPALVILDLMLPGQSGFDVLRALRSTWAGPILI
ncbi:MAG: response regulator, partial [Myxococcota bacterium]